MILSPWPLSRWHGSRQQGLLWQGLSKVNGPSKEQAIQALEMKLKKGFQVLKKDFLKEIGYLESIEETFDQETGPRTALERLAGEPI